MSEDGEFNEKQIVFKSGDRFCFYTGGMDAVFSEDKVDEYFIDTNSIAELKEHISKKLKHRMAGIRGIKDDSTLLLFEIR